MTELTAKKHSLSATSTSLLQPGRPTLQTG